MSTSFLQRPPFNAPALTLGAVAFGPERRSPSRREAELAARVRTLERELKDRFRQDHDARVERRVRAAQCLAAAEQEAVLMVCQIVSQALGIEVVKVLGKSKKWPVARARLCAQRLCHVRLGLAVADVAAVWGVNRVTLQSNCKRMEGFITQGSPDGFAWRTAERAVELWCEQNHWQPREEIILKCDCGQPGHKRPSGAISCDFCMAVERRYYYDPRQPEKAERRAAAKEFSQPEEEAAP